MSYLMQFEDYDLDKAWDDLVNKTNAYNLTFKVLNIAVDPKIIQEVTTHI